MHPFEGQRRSRHLRLLRDIVHERGHELGTNVTPDPHSTANTTNTTTSGIESAAQRFSSLLQLLADHSIGVMLCRAWASVTMNA